MAHVKPPKSSELKKLICSRFKAACDAYLTKEAPIAEALGINAKQLNGYTTGRNYPDAKVVVDFCELTGCTADWIYLGKLESKMPPKMAALIGVNHPNLLADIKQAKGSASQPAEAAVIAQSEAAPSAAQAKNHTKKVPVSS